MNYAVEATGLTKFYGELAVVDGVSFSVKKGENFGFLGPNGAGKTTTIRMLTGLTKPSSGFAQVNGFNICKNLIKVKQSIGVVPDESILYHELSVEENLKFMAHLYDVPSKEILNRVELLLNMFQLTEKRKAFFRTLSKGMKRRVTVAAALVHDPLVLFLDEPTDGLDVASARNLMSVIQSLNKKGVTIFLTTHNILEADQLCNRIAIIVKGKIIDINTPENLKSLVAKDKILEIGLEDSIDLMLEQGNGIIGVKKASKMGDKVRMVTTDIVSTLQEVISFVSANGLKLTSINTVAPSLEEAFVQMTGIKGQGRE